MIPKKKEGENSSRNGEDSYYFRKTGKSKSGRRKRKMGTNKFDFLI